MLCQHCGVNTATTHIRRTVNGTTEEMMLCSDCAARLGYNQLSFFTGGLLGSLFAGEMASSPAADAIRCPVCHISFEEIARSGKVGCAHCYTKFKERLTPTVEKLHGKADHVGKSPVSKEAPPPEKPLLQQLKDQLAEAIETQEFEKAAQLRDQIRELEGEQHD